MKELQLEGEDWSAELLESTMAKTNGKDRATQLWD